MKSLLWVLVWMACLVTSELSAADIPFETATPGRALVFPRDHGKHADFQTEWWYFTGNVESADRRGWGFQLTFFRRSLTREPVRSRSAWRVKDIYPAHFALTDFKNRRFFHTEIVSREGPGLAGAAMDRLHVRVKDWIAEARDGSFHLQALAEGHALKLTLVPEKPLVLHGRSGFSAKGKDASQASYYYSHTRLSAEGTLTFGGISHKVTGQAWMDHEFGSSILLKDQVGWDWFSLQLDDGTEIMAFYLRKEDGAVEPLFGTFVPIDGKPVDLQGRHIKVAATGTWTSPHTKAVYPSGWTLSVPDLEVDLKIAPACEDQELFSGKTAGIVYWEGAVVASGTRQGKKVQGKGYVELTGYAGTVGGQL